MHTIESLIKPSLDAIDYNSPTKQKLFNDAYLESGNFKKACNSNCYYIVGDKGSGKTAVALRLQATSPNKIGAKVISITDTQYSRFVNQKISGKLLDTDYSTLWRPTILYLIARLIVEKEKSVIHKLTKKFSRIEHAISKFDQQSQIPELEYIMEFVSSLTEESTLKATLPKVVEATIGEKGSQSVTTKYTELKNQLLESEKILKSAIDTLQIKNDIVLFLDGLDAKPNSVSFEEFKHCLIGLSEAAWHLNSDYFTNHKHSPSRIRVVLLLRPDVFDSLNIHNSNCKLRDNAVIMAWNTTTEDYKNSDIFNMANKFFLQQTGNKNDWAHYYDNKVRTDSKSFKTLLTNTFHRPRDIFSAIEYSFERMIQTGNSNKDFFPLDIFIDSDFRDKHSEYMLGEIKNYANFYISNSDFEKYIKFFQYLNGSTRFNYSEFTSAFQNFEEEIPSLQIQDKQFLSSAESLLQFWYDVNIICYKERPTDGSSPFFHWSYRERSASRIMPKVKVNSEYEIHQGVSKSLDLGKKFIAHAT